MTASDAAAHSCGLFLTTNLMVPASSRTYLATQIGATMENPMALVQHRWQDDSHLERETDGGRTVALEASGGEAVSNAVAHGNESMPKVLLIEDDKETADEIRAELGDSGLEVAWAANGVEGLDKARSGDAEAIIVDRLLPGMDGLAIIEALRH